MAPTERAMSSYEARRATFFQQNDGNAPKSRKKSSAAALHSWPHPVAGASAAAAAAAASSSSKAGRHFPTPSEMANAGLYFLPNHADANDACAVYPEGTIVCNWKAGDDAEARVRQADENAALVMLAHSKASGKDVAGVWQWTSEELMPNGKSMTETRLRTFSGFWPYDGKKGWKPTSKKLALAGFHFTPNDEEEDCATCVYCDCSLGGWEKTDDPVKEHQRRRSNCAFFKCQLVTPVIAVVAEGSKQATEAKRSRAVSKRKVPAEDESEKKESEVNAEEQPERVKATSPARPKKQRKSEEKKDIAQAETAAPPAQLRKASSKALQEEAVPRPAKAIVQMPPPSAAIEPVRAYTPPAEFRSHSRSSLHPTPFSIAPLDALPKPSKAEREMTVEAWLKMQVTKACEEMEREGANRIEALRREMANARGQVEAMLRGRPDEKVAVAAIAIK